MTVGSTVHTSSVVENCRSPVWKLDNSFWFEASDGDSIDICLFDEHTEPRQSIVTLVIPFRSLSSLEK